MGQKANPISIRLQINKNWSSKWFASNNFAQNLLEDLKLRDAIKAKLGRNSAIDKIEIRRDPREIKISIYTAKPGIIIGRSGKGISDLDEYLSKKMLSWQKPESQKKAAKFKIEIMEIREPEVYARLIAQNIAAQLEKRVAFRRAVKQAITRVMQNRQALGIKVIVAGRLGGAEIARRERFVDGQIPLGTFKADISYAQENAYTTFGTIGVKVWIHRKTSQTEETTVAKANLGNKYANA